MLKKIQKYFVWAWADSSTAFCLKSTLKPVLTLL